MSNFSDFGQYHTHGMEVRDFKVGQRVELHPALDLWMMGARYGEVVRLGRSYLGVKLDATGKVVSLTPNRVNPIGG